MSFKPQKFIEDRNYAIGKSLYLFTIVLVLLAVFLGTKIISEAYSWNDTTGDYAANTISVEAVGEVNAIPDVATFSFGVVEEAESVSAAQEAASKKMNLALAYLRENGVSDEDIKTTNFSVNPRYEYGFCQGFNCPPQKRELVAYEVNQRVEVKVRELSRAGELLAGITAQNVSNLSGLSFTIDDTDALKEEARSKAVEAAREKAKRLAKDLGVRLKKVVSFSEDGGGGPIYLEARSASVGGAFEDAVVPDIPAGENTIISRVFITYEIK